jgi:1,4-alpha-glucan branching enzyme
VLPLSHDEVVHGKGSLLAKCAGADDWQRLATLRTLYTWMWAHPGDPLLFMGAELAPWTEWSEERGIEWHLRSYEHHAGVERLVRSLNKGAVDWPAVWERDRDPMGFQWLDADDADRSIYSFLRWGGHGANAVAVAANFTPVPREGERLGVPWAGEWTLVVDSDAVTFGGSGFGGERRVVVATDEPWQGQPASLQFDLPPLAAVWWASQRP